MAILEETLFWTHTLIILVFMLLGFFVSLSVIFVIIGLHQIHLFLFHGCAITKLQRKIGTVRHNEYFFQTFFRRLFQKELNRAATYTIQVTVLIMPIVTALIVKFAA